jgi:hypothetical protein
MLGFTLVFFSSFFKSNKMFVTLLFDVEDYVFFLFGKLDSKSKEFLAPRSSY